jgi:hypothetical protein
MFQAIALIAAIIAFFVFPTFRKFIIVAAIILACVIFGYIANQKSEEAASKTLVRGDQLDFQDLRLGPESYGSAYKLTGRIKNTSEYSVFEVKAKVQIQDCDEKSHCEVVGEEEQNIAPLVPPGQVRDIDESIYFGGSVHIKGRLQWNYSISEIRGRS